jgi:uncharacterized protein
MLLQSISQELHISENQVQGVLSLFSDGATVPFIARYRKEATGSLDEVVIGSIKELQKKHEELEARRSSICETLKKNDLYTEQLSNLLSGAGSLSELEDIYLPYRPKRTTRGQKAREKGLAPLAKKIETNAHQVDISQFINKDLGVNNYEEALAGARDIIAEEISEAQKCRVRIRALFSTEAIIHSKVSPKKVEDGEKFRDYFDWVEPAAKAPGHRLLAMFRGEREKILRISIRPPKESCLRALKKMLLKQGPFQDEISLAIEDCYQRLLAPSMENELAARLKTRADDEAIAVFVDNLRQLLLSSPLGRKRVMAIDPGYRTGAKVVCLDKQGDLLDRVTLFPTFGGAKREEAAKKVKALIQTHSIEAVGIGNGTAGRETEEFIRKLDLGSSIVITLVNEDGASIYSASAIAREEFPDEDITVRGAVSIGRRLQDPLAELVKIDPKSIGVGQYQHDVHQTRLKESLEMVVESCVNNVGVELNSASVSLLNHVAGLSKILAKNIVDYRSTNGAFGSRKELLKVARLGPKAFEQCAGFLRITDAANPLDSTAVHPERYKLVGQMAQNCGVSVKELLTSTELRKNIIPKNYVGKDIGLPTILDILSELEKPGRDPREKFEQFKFDDSILSLDDLYEGIRLPAIITNVTNFGAFADIGIKQDGLIHISQLADRFVKNPGEVVKLGQQVIVRVLEIDKKRGRIALSLKDV